MEYIIALHIYNKNYQPLGRNGEVAKFGSLEEAVACIRDNKIPVEQNTVILRIIGNFIADEYDAAQIKDLIAKKAVATAD